MNNHMTIYITGKKLMTLIRDVDSLIEQVENMEGDSFNPVSLQCRTFAYHHATARLIYAITCATDHFGKFEISKSKLSMISMSRVAS